MSNTIGRLDFEITSMDKGSSLPFDPYVRLCLKQYGATTRDGAPIISANLMTVQEIDEYVAMLGLVEPTRLHQRVHQGHNCWLLPEEERFVTAELIEATCMVGTPTQLAGRIRDLETAGLSQVMLLPPLAVKEQVLTDVAQQVFPLLSA